MPRNPMAESVPIPLLGGAYQARSLVAGAQRSINLFPESNPPESSPPVPVTHYPTPGLLLLKQGPVIEAVRQSYTASNGELFVVIGPNLYFVSAVYAFTLLGVIPDRVTPVIFSDNGSVILLVDGSAAGWCIDMATHTFAAVNDPNFLGSVWVDYVDGFFVLHQPGTRIWYISLANVTQANLTGAAAFSAQDRVARNGGSDPIVGLRVAKRVIVLVGALTSEVWVDSGEADFAFSALPNGFIEHGCIAPYSIAKIGETLFWLMQDKQGQGIVIMTDENYRARRVSTHAIDAAFQAYTTITDALAYTHQQQGHGFFVLTFPTADKTWAMELETQQWHERASIDGNGVFHRHRSNCFAQAYNTNIVGDYQNGNLYNYDPNTFTDNLVPIPRVRTFPHLVMDGTGFIAKYFRADMEVGQSNVVAADSMISLRWSYDRGASFGNPVLQQLGAAGEFLTSPFWSPIGGPPTRDLIFELSWSAPVKTALNRAFTAVEQADM